MAKKRRKIVVRHFDDTDIIALALIFSCLILRAMGRNGIVDMTLAAIIGFYFGGKFNHKK